MTPLQKDWLLFLALSWLFVLYFIAMILSLITAQDEKIGNAKPSLKGPTPPFTI